LGKIKILYPQKHLISYGYVSKPSLCQTDLLPSLDNLHIRSWNIYTWMEPLGASTERNVGSGGGSILSCCPRNPHGYEWDL